MAEFHLAHEYHLPDYDGLMLRQDNIGDAAQVILNQLDARYVTALLTKTAKVQVATWAETGESQDRYAEMLMTLPDVVRERLAVAHAVFATGEQQPDPEDIPDPAAPSLLADWDELDEDAQENVLLNALHFTFQLKIGANVHPYAIVYSTLTELPTAAASALMSSIMQQYVRQYHLSRQNRN